MEQIWQLYNDFGMVKDSPSLPILSWLQCLVYCGFVSMPSWVLVTATNDGQVLPKP
jgi:hypothetical protein